MVIIDVEFDFTSDSPGYWDGFWENNDGLGGGGSDPDSASAVFSGIIRSYGARNCRMGKRWSWRLARMGVCYGMYSAVLCGSF